MKERHWGGKNGFGEGRYRDFQVIKIVSYPLVIYTTINQLPNSSMARAGTMVAQISPTNSANIFGYTMRQGPEGSKKSKSLSPVMR